MKKIGKKIKKSRLVKNMLLITMGSFIYAFAFDSLFIPNNMVMGGFTGLAQTLNRFIPAVPVGVTVIALNVPLFILGIRRQGFRLLFSSVFAMSISSVFIDVLALAVKFKPIEDHLVACLIGGGMVGLSMGILLLVGATTGGVELAARLLKYHYRHISIGKLCLFIDLGVIALYTLVYKNINDGLYAAIAMYISSLAMDAVVYGRNTSKVACIICSEGKRVRERLIELDLGVTNIRAHGGYSDSEKDILICAFKPSRISELKSAIMELDKTAFVIICNAEDIFGEGFADVSMDNL
ncbi:MAG: YitT family protein [Clostridia bacterium]|nr:YitT family protein [Clostridia bacterium]